MASSVGSIPIALLLDWRSPDRDIHRLLVTAGPLCTVEIQARLSVSRRAVWNALGRMGRLGVVQQHSARRGRGAIAIWTAAYQRRRTVYDGGHGMAARVRQLVA